MCYRPSFAFPSHNTNTHTRVQTFSGVVGRERMGMAFPHKKLSGNGVPTREILRLFCIITIKFLTVNYYVTTFSAPQTMSKLDIRICKALEIVPLKHISKGTCSIHIVEGLYHKFHLTLGI